MDSEIIPLVDLRAQYKTIENEVVPRIRSVVESASFILGPDVAQFESAFASYLKVNHCIGVGSGTAALKIALSALGIGAGDEVIIPGNTYIACALAVSAVGATPVLVDIDDYYLIDCEKIESAITPRTKAIMPVHLYGQVADMDAIHQSADRHGLKVIEDACQAHGACFNGKRAGAFGDVACFSFYPSKNLGCYGDGGAVVTASDQIAERVRLLRNLGQSHRDHHVIRGYNSRLDTIQAAVLNVKLVHLDKWNECRRRAAATYDGALSAGGFLVPKSKGAEAHVYHLYVIEVENRDDVRAALASNNIQGGIHYPTPIHQQPAYIDLGVPRGALPRTETAANRILSLPMYPEISERQIYRVVDVLKESAKIPNSI